MDGVYLYSGSWLTNFAYLACAKEEPINLPAKERFGG
jgi:hypothetical protein